MPLDERGHEVPDQTPVEIPAGFNRPVSLQEEMQRLIRLEMSRAAMSGGLESFDEANDFDIGDPEGELDSPYELTPMQEEAGYVDGEEEQGSTGDPERDRDTGRGVGDDERKGGGARRGAPDSRPGATSGEPPRRRQSDRAPEAGEGQGRRNGDVA